MTRPIKYGSAQLLNKNHDRASFDCGVEPLNDFLKKYALQNQKKDVGRTYVVLNEDGRIAGFYTLVFSGVSVEETTPRVASGLGRYPVPVILLARLAVDLREKGRGLGSGLIRDALLRAVSASDIAGLRAVVVHAKDKAAKEFYQRFGFEPSPHNENHLYMILSEVRKSLSGIDDGS